MQVNYNTFQPSASAFLDYPPRYDFTEEIEFSAAESEKYRKQQAKEQEFIDAKEFLDGLKDAVDIDPLDAASLYFEQWPHIQPYPLRPCRREQQRAAWRMFNRAKQPMTRLFESLDRPHLYTLHAEHLDLPPEYGRPHNFYDRAIIDGWKNALKKEFSGAFFWCLHLASRIHCHVIADGSAGLLNLSRTGEIIKPITQTGKDAMRVVTYLCKPKSTSTVPHLSQWIQAKREYNNNLPKMQGHFGLPTARPFFAN
jgi:hypothetical protein